MADSRDEAIDNFRRQSKQMFIKRLEITVGVGPPPKLSPDISARRAPAGMQKDRVVGPGH